MQHGNAKRIGIFGGSFDPVHNGHLEIAKACQSQARLDSIWFVPTAHQPLKPGGPIAPSDDRLAMLQRAIAGRREWEISTIELDRGGVSYTCDTLAEMHRRQPDADLFFLLGADSLAEFTQWRKPVDVCRLATLLIVRRPESPPPDLPRLAEFAKKEGLNSIRAEEVAMPETPISSSELRQAIARGDEQWKDWTPPAVAQLITERNLYGPAEGSPAGKPDAAK